ncbi:MAG: YdcF family protein [Acidobacteria bacterium]|nr:YdcF family protein [Acidobacteriota bacterium]
MRRAWLLPLMVWTLCAAADPAHAPLALKHPLEDKNFYLLSAMERTPAVSEAVRADPALARLGEAKRAALAEAVKSCGADVGCYARPLRWTDEEIGQVRLALGAPAVKALAGPIRQSGAYQRYAAGSDEELLGKAWEDAARGVNLLIDVYALGQPGRYQTINGPAYDVKSAAYGRVVQLIAAVLEDDAGSLRLFFEPSLRFALELMMANHRDEAGRHEPLEAGENRAAFRRAATVQWARYPYTVIVVPGAGPDRPGVALSPAGRLRVMLAVKRYREGKAPFILVSGGYVHPNLTPYAEAMEMKKALRTEFDIPEDAILVDPHARHTTTNLRNAARLMYRYRIPFDRKALIVTDASQSAYIEAEGFTQRCAKELGYQPHRLGARTSRFDLEFLPRIDSLEIDPSDPLDP